MDTPWLSSQEDPTGCQAHALLAPSRLALAVEGMLHTGLRAPTCPGLWHVRARAGLAPAPSFLPFRMFSPLSTG